MPEILSTSINSNEAIIELKFNQSSPFFKGHFPGLPVLPGFVQVHFAINLAVKYFDINPEISNIKKLKFTKIIAPNQEMSLSLKFDKNKKNISFKYHIGAHNFSSGLFYLKN